MVVDEKDADGPPPPPFVRRRRRRRNALLGTAAAAIVGIPLVLGVVGNSAGTVDAPSASSGDDGDGEPADGRDDQDGSAEPDGGSAPDAPGDGAPNEGSAPDAEVPSDTVLEHPDPGDHGGVDAVYAELLVDVDRSEMAMIGFQEELSAAISDAPLGDTEELGRRIQEAAADGQAELDRMRQRLAEPLDEEGAEAVREVYLSHLEAWEEYMAAIEDDPGMLGAEDRSRTYLLAINVSADRFARTLEAELPDDVDDELQRFADAILERGFRDVGDSDV